jgi:hypothetical protein
MPQHFQMAAFEPYDNVNSYARSVLSGLNSERLVVLLATIQGTHAEHLFSCARPGSHSSLKVLHAMGLVYAVW